MVALISIPNTANSVRIVDMIINSQQHTGT